MAKAKKKVVKKKVAKKKPAVKKVTKKIIKKPVKKAIKRPAKKAAVKKAAKKTTPKAAPGEVLIGTITHYFPKVRAAVIKLKLPLSVGQTLRFKGHTTDFKQLVNSIQLDHVPVTMAKKGQEIGLLVNSRVREHDTVYRIGI